MIAVKETVLTPFSKAIQEQTLGLGTKFWHEVSVEDVNTNNNQRKEKYIMLGIVIVMTEIKISLTMVYFDLMPKLIKRSCSSKTSPSF